MRKFFLGMLVLGAGMTKSLWASSATWSGATSTDWTLTGNWTTGGPPGANQTATFSETSSSGANPNPTIGANSVSIGQIAFGAPSPTTINGTGGVGLLTFSMNSGSAMITATTTGNIIAADIQLSSPLTTSVPTGMVLTLSGNVSGASLLTIGGAGTTILSDTTNSNSGTITINSGILQIQGGEGSLGSASTVTIASGTFQAGTGLSNISSSYPFSLSSAGTIDSNDQNLTINGAISETVLGSSLNIVNSGVSAGTVILGSIVSSYRGGTTLTSGQLEISNDLNLGPSGTLTLTAGSTLLFGSGFTLGSPSGREVALTGTGNITIDGGGFTSIIASVITGPSTATLTVMGVGTSLTFQGANSYLGQTIVDTNATLIGNSTNFPGDITIDGTLRFNQTISGTYSHVLRGSGALNIQGGGALTLSGNSSTFSGNTTISNTGGSTALIVSGDLSSSPISVGTGCFLRGSGSVGSTLSIAGTIEGGSSGSGTLTVNGNLSFAGGGGTLLAKITPLTSGLIGVTGTATLTNGVLLVEPITDAGFFGLSQTHTILTGAAVAGSFSSYSISNNNFSLSAPTISGTAVQITVNALNPFFNFPCGNYNECAVAHNIDAINAAGGISSDMVSVINAMTGLSNAAVNNALDQMHPAALSAFAEMQSELGGQLLSIFHRRPEIRCGCFGKNRFWIEPFGNWLHEKKQGMEIGFHAETKGIAFGYDRQFFNCWTVGLGGACNQSDLQWTLDRGYAYVNGLYGSIYSDLTLDHFYLGASAYAGKDWYETVRQIHFTWVDRQAKSNSHGLDAAGQLTMAYLFGVPYCLLYPYATVDYLYLQNSSFSESGASSLNLNVDRYTSSTLRAEAGGAWQFSNRNGDGTICISPLISMGYVLELPLHRSHYRSTFKGQSISFQTKGWDMAWQLLNLRFGLGITYRCFTLDAQYIADISPEGDSPFMNQRANFRCSLGF